MGINMVGVVVGSVNITVGVGGGGGSRLCLLMKPLGK